MTAFLKSKTNIIKLMFPLTLFLAISLLISNREIVLKTYADASSCEYVCQIETGDPDGYCTEVCADNNPYYGCQFYSLIWGNDWGGDPSYATNPETWCSETQTPQAICHNQCIYDNGEVYDVDCSDICNYSTNQTECEATAYTVIGGSANIYFCTFLPSSTPVLEVTLNDPPFYLTAGGITTISGSVQGSEEIVDISLYDIENSQYYPCNYYEDMNYLYYFNCNTPNISNEGTHTFEVYTEEYSGMSTTSEIIAIEVDLEDDKDLASLWRFDDPSYWLREDITGSVGTNHSATQSSQGYISSALDSSTGYLTLEDPTGRLSFDQPNSHFIVEASVYKDNFAGNDTRIAGKYNEANNENSWLIGTDAYQGLYCAIWINGQQEAIHTNTKLSPGEWHKVSCEWNAVNGTLKAYIDGIEDTSSRTLPIGSVLSPSTKDFAIGARATGGDNFGGLIDNVKIYSITEILDNEAPLVILDSEYELKNTTVSSIVTGSATDDYNITSIQISRYGTNVWDDCVLSNPNSTSTNFSCTTGPLLNLTTNYFIIRATDENGNTTNTNYQGYQVEVDTLGGMDIISLWRMETNGTITDDINGNNGIVNAPTINTTGKYNQAIDLTSDRYITINDTNRNFDFNQDKTLPQFKVEASIKASTLTGEFRRVIGKYSQTESEDLWVLGVDSWGGVYCSVSLEGGTESIETGNLTSPILLDTDTWIDIGCYWNGNTGELTALINGDPVKTITSSIQKSERAFAESTSNLSIGASPSGENPLNGLVDNIKISYQAIPVGDSNPPIVTIDTPENAQRLTNNTPTISGTVYDIDLVQNLEYLVLDTYLVSGGENIDDYTWITIPSADGTWNSAEEDFTFTTEPIVNEGTYYIFIRGTDSYGNTSYYNKSGNLVTYDNLSNQNYMLANTKVYLELIDTTAPQITLNDLKPNPTTSTNITLTGHVKDNENDTQSPITEIQYQLDNGGIWTNATIISTNQSGTEKNFSIPLNNLTIGTHIVSVRAKDASNNSTGTDFETCYYTCVTVGLEDEDLCRYACDSYYKTNNKSITFEIVPQEDKSPEIKETIINFSDYINVDTTNSTAIIGDNKSVLPKTYNFFTSLELYTNNEEFGYLYGTQNTGVFNSIDNNLWLTFNNGTFAYYDKTTGTITKYPQLVEGAKILELIEFSSSGNRYLAISLDGNRPLYIYSLGTTATNLTDDSSVHLGTLLGVNSCLTNINIDDRNGYTSIYGLICNDSIYGSPTAEIAHVDTKGTITNVGDDITTLISSSDGMGTNISSLYFDLENNRLLAGDYTTQRTTFYDDNGTPNDKTDDLSRESVGSYMACTPIKILKDINGWYWYLGSCGISVVKVDDLEEVSCNQGYIPLFSLSDLNNQTTKHIALVVDPLSGRQETIITTEEGTMYIYDNNGTYENLEDDQLTLYTYPSEIYGSTQTYSVAISKNLDSWLMLAGKGLYKVSSTKSYSPSAELVIWPNITAGFVETDHVTLNSVTGRNLGNTTYFVSNDGGLTWNYIDVGETISFSTSGNMLKLRIILRPENNDTPEILGVSISYASYDTSQLENANLLIDYPNEGSVGNSFNTYLELKDELGLTPNWEGTVSVTAYDTTNNQSADNCFNYTSKDLTLTKGQGNTITTPLCNGSYYFVAQAEDGRAVKGEDILIKGIKDSVYTSQNTLTRQIPLCGNGILDYGEQCDYAIEGDNLSCMEYDSKYIYGEITCNNSCEYVLENCIEKDLTLDVEKDTDTTNPIKHTDKNSINLQGLVSKTVNILATGIILSILPFLPYYLLRIFLGVLSALGIKGKGNKYAYVYNSITKEPIKGAIVRIYDISNKLVTTEISGQYGEITTKLNQGTYSLQITKPGFIFPSKIITNAINNLNQNIYRNKIKVTNTEELLVAVPIDPNTTSFISRLRSFIFNQINTSIYILNLLIFVILLTYSIFLYTESNTLVNLMTMIVYIVLTVFVLLSKITTVKYGTVTDTNANKLENIHIMLHEKEFGRPVAERVTDKNGRYRIIIQPGEYLRRIFDKRYSLDEKDSNVIAKKDPSIINDDLVVRTI